MSRPRLSVVSFLKPLLMVGAALSSLAGGAAVPAPAPSLRVEGPTCTERPAAPATPVTRPLPTGITGRVSFYGAVYDPATRLPLRAVTLGDVDALYPLASAFKPLVVRGVLQDVDAGKFSLSSRYTTTAANRSIENYPAGTNTLRELIRRAIFLSDNTASDLLHLTHGPLRLARAVRAQSPCTTVVLPTKALWTAQAGLSPGVLGADTLAGARAYAAQPFEQRLTTAARLIAAAREVQAPQLEQDLDTYFHGPTYTPELELYLQNTGTARAYTDLMARVLGGEDLNPATRAVFREVMATGCCRPKAPRLGATYWAAKAGSGWRFLTLTGYLELPGGQRLAYTYLNDQSDTTDSEDMERQIRPLVTWIESTLMDLSRQP